MKPLKKIKNSLLSRQYSTAKLTILTAKDLIKNRDKDSLKSTLAGALSGNIEKIVEELDVMKGSLMKLGQMLSLFGGSFLPKELQVILKKLENKSSYLAWDEIKKQIPYAWIEQLDIEQTPLASASLGQVHLAQDGNKEYCMKIQYKGVRKAIDNDIKTLKYLLKMFKFIPSEIDLDKVFIEIKEMLKHETDYYAEAENTILYQKLLKDYSQYKVPTVLKEFSNERILTTEYIKGTALNELDSLQLTQHEKNELGKNFMRLFLLELFVFERVQTDAHFGNYLIIADNEQPIWGLIDFGATKEPEKIFIKNYQELVLSLRDNNRDQFIKIVQKMGYLSSSRDTDWELFWEYAQIIGQPFQTNNFDWGNTDIADKVFEYIPKLFKSISIGNPPPESLFLDKKLGGVFFVLQKLEARFDLNTLLEEVLQIQKDKL